MRKPSIFLFLFFCCFSSFLQAQSFEKANIANVTVINSSKLDFSPTFYKDGIVFVSNTDIVGKNKMFDKKINQKTLSLFLSKNNEKGGLEKPEPFALELVSTVHEGPLTFSKDYKIVYFSRNNNKKGGKAKYVELIDRMQIFESHVTNKGWSKPERVEFDRETKDYCHPTLSADGKRLYFASNRKGGYGGMDIYVSEILPNGKMGTPINLGPSINSDKNEVFPFIHDDGTLFFSSNRLGGSGGLDIYYAKNLGDFDTFDKPLSIGTPFNSDRDDFGFIIDEKRKSGYFSSNRNGGFGEDDIYSFVLTDELKPAPLREQEIILTVLDRKTQKPIDGADINLLLNDKLLNNTAKFTDKNGKVTLKFVRSDDFEVKINKSNYTSEFFTLTKNDLRPEIIVQLDSKSPDDIAQTEATPEKKTATDVAQTESQLDKKVEDNIAITDAQPNKNTPNRTPNKENGVNTEAANNNNLQDITIQVLDRDTRKPINKANVNWQSINTILTNNNGYGKLKLNRNTDIAINISKENYFTESINYSKSDNNTTITVLMRQTKAIATTEAALDPAKAANPSSIMIEKPITSMSNTDFYALDIIYYDFDRSFIRKDAAKKLDSLIVVMNQHPDMMIELEGHTDSRGPNRYNDNLSERRSINAAAYLIKKGISRHRIKRIARGELLLTNDCYDDVPCAETDHQANRRTVVRIVKYGKSVK